MRSTSRRLDKQPFFRKSPAVANGGNQRQIGEASNPRKQAKSVGIGCHRLPETIHGKQGVCGGLPPVAGGPLPAKEGVDPEVIVDRDYFLVQSVLSAVGARVLIANRNLCMPCGSRARF